MSLREDEKKRKRKSENEDEREDERRRENSIVAAVLPMVSARTQAAGACHTRC